MLRRGNTDYFNDAIMAYLATNGGTPLPANFPPSNSLWIGLSSTIPDQAGNNVTEPSGGNYGRQKLITASGVTNQFYQVLSGIYSNTAGVQFPVPTVSWSTNSMQAVTVWDASSSGNLLSWDAGMTPFFALLGMAGPYIPPGGLRVGINTGWGRRGCLAEWIADALMAHLYQSAAFSQTASSVALCSSIPLPSDQDIHSTREIQNPVLATNGVNYARASIGTLTGIKAGRYANSTVVQFNYPTGSWGDAVAWALMNDDGSTSLKYGKMWFAGLLNPPQTVNQNRPFPPFLNRCLQLGFGQ